ncbi:S8 family serine peptidase [Microbacterium sp. ARD32]|uniref:S8 family serine peptidase n=1 Tax=Microbacterium sp. ARD32 TaxID=2962577 RepID=UPI0028813029|nr:S8 family serine peptidase [Microbacterium sp. ARD32]MDT0156127.1 S8 family serine peptidase [Microbacterium sp. ARD32]
MRALRSAAAVVGIVVALGLGAPAADADQTPPASAPSMDAGQQCTPGKRLLSSAPSYLVDRLGLAEAWTLSRGRGVTVAVVDSGVQAGNVHLKGALVPGFTSFGGGSAPADADVAGHGTAVAGLIAARRVEGSGVIGIAPQAKIMPVRAFEAAPDSNGSSRDLVVPTTASIVAGIRWAADHGAQIINVSLSDDGSAGAYRSAVDYAHDRGALVIASAGNRRTAGTDGPDPAHFYPGELPGALAVAAVLADGSWSAESSYAGEHVDIAAPGQSVPTAYISGGDCVLNPDSASSSYATAIISGAAALIASRYPDESPDEWAFRLTQSALRVSPGQRSDTVGWGEVRPAGALALIDDGSLPGPDSPAHPPQKPEPQAERTVDLDPVSDPLDPARVIVGWGLGAGATISIVLLLISRSRARRLPG